MPTPRTDAAEMIFQQAAALYDAGCGCGAESSSAKLLAPEAAWKAGNACCHAFGGFAFATEYDIECKWRECPVQHVSGLPRSY